MTTILIPVHLPSSICSVSLAICSNLIHFPSYFSYFCISFSVSSFFCSLIPWIVWKLDVMAGYVVCRASNCSNIVMWPYSCDGRRKLQVIFIAGQFDFSTLQTNLLVHLKSLISMISNHFFWYFLYAVLSNLIFISYFFLNVISCHFL